MTESRSGAGNVQVDLGTSCHLIKQEKSVLRQEETSWKKLPVLNNRASERNLRKIIGHFWKTQAN